MLNKNSSTDTNTHFQGDEHKEQNSKFNLSKFDFDLYHEEDDKSETVIRVKRVSMPNKGEKWKVMTDNKVTFIVESSKISKKEREFLQTINGFNFLLQQAKIGIKSLNNLKAEIKKIIVDNTVQKPKESKKPKVLLTKNLKPKSRKNKKQFDARLKNA